MLFKRFLIGFILWLAGITGIDGVNVVDAGGQRGCEPPPGIPLTAGDYLMSFRYLLPFEPENIETHGIRAVRVNQCSRTLTVTVFQPGSIPEQVILRAKLNELGDVSLGRVNRINFGLTGGSPEEVIISDVEVAMSKNLNFYGSGYLDNPNLGDFDGSRVIFVFEPI